MNGYIPEIEGYRPTLARLRAIRWDTVSPFTGNWKRTRVHAIRYAVLDDSERDAVEVITLCGLNAGSTYDPMTRVWKPKRLREISCGRCRRVIETVGVAYSTLLLESPPMGVDSRAVSADNEGAGQSSSA